MLAVPALVLSVRAQRAGSQQAAQTSANTQFYTVAPGVLTITVSALGAVEADNSARLAFTTGGRVAEVLAQTGDYVVSGDVIARLENTTQQLAFDQAVLAVEMARLRKQDLLAGPDSGQIAVAQANIDAALGSYAAAASSVSPSDLRAAELSYQQALNALENAQTARATASSGQPEQAYQILDAQVGQASFNAEIARLQLEALRSSGGGQAGAAWARVEQARAELAQIQAGPTQAQIDTADAAIAQAEAALERAQTALNETLLGAPFDGVITSLGLEAGALAAPGAAVGTIIDTEPLHVQVDVDEIDVREITEGMQAQITFDALADMVVGARVEQIALVGVNDGGIISYPVTLMLDSAIDPRVRIGMTAEAQVVVATRSDVLLVPNRFIRLDRQRDRAFVNLVNAEGLLEEVEISLGLQGANDSEVVAGLRTGDVIAVNVGGDAIPAFGG
jgi:HlyD family secretion protein